jgi:hypothetical protein
MAGYDKAGTLFALAMRVTKLGATGAPLVGVGNAYISDALVKADIGLTYEEANTITQLNGTGVACVSYSAPRTLKEGSISGLQICQPDPNLLQFMIGGDVINDVAVPPNQIGYRAPLTGEVANPNGISLEFWSQAIIGAAQAVTLPYIHWVLPKCRLVPAGSWSISGTAAMVPEFEGTAEQNALWDDGPVGDFDYPSDRVWQFVRVAAIPTVTAGAVTVVA